MAVNMTPERAKMKSRRGRTARLWRKVRPHLLPDPVIRAILALETLTALWAQDWTSAFIASATLLLTFLPQIFASRWQIHIPVTFSSAIIVFTFATLFMGSAWNYYERFWWWDLLMHGGSAVGFGLLGFLFVFLMFKGNKYNAPPVSVAFVAFCFGLTIGVIWEIFEYFLDVTFGMTTQGTGIDDTMHDLIVDTIGAAIGALAGFLYLKGQVPGWFGRSIAEAVRRNRRLFRRNRQ